MNVEELEGIVTLDECVIYWYIKGVGFGQFHITESEDEELGQKVFIYNEGMSKDFIKAVLCKMVDDAVLLED